MATIEDIARVAHEANRALQQIQNAPGIPVAAEWDDFPEDEREGVIDGVRHALNGASPEQLHQAWCDMKTADGWTHGPVKDPDAKTHPCLVPYDQLPEEQRRKDALFHAIVHALSN
ncbi:MAG TPA: RyR domain-containing protein [Streptomyces sp.]|nr:RyR domain-containing protein [Streptomyces sp.]